MFVFVPSRWFPLVGSLLCFTVFSFVFCLSLSCFCLLGSPFDGALSLVPSCWFPLAFCFYRVCLFVYVVLFVVCFIVCVYFCVFILSCLYGCITIVFVCALLSYVSVFCFYRVCISRVRVFRVSIAPSERFAPSPSSPVLRMMMRVLVLMMMLVLACDRMQSVIHCLCHSGLMDASKMLGFVAGIRLVPYFTSSLMEYDRSKMVFVLLAPFVYIVVLDCIYYGISICV